ncbi:N-acetyltransferase [Paenibacillus endoradicis]|uniref:N-acetyltransferase n=1 Tax=Paenibacillus endoradicis TaxID=2972487 RepID=UPI0021593408|nr:N-acetyltransferase [Paenibacillus endoradicis]MCR8658710.1 N-acetyltransferase [Paenibacillus endoradicis]
MIRKFKNEDIDRVMSIWEASTIKAHPFIDKDYWKSNYDTVKNVYMPMSETFVYDDGEHIKGFISVINNDFIGALFVDVNDQGLGIGSQLMDYTITKYEKLNLAVYKDNEQSVRFYMGKGFKIVGEQKNEDSGYEEYIMEKSKLE